MQEFHFLNKPVKKLPFLIYTNCDLRKQENAQYFQFCQQHGILVHAAAVAGSLQIVFSEVSLV